MFTIVHKLRILIILNVRQTYGEKTKGFKRLSTFALSSVALV